MAHEVKELRVAVVARDKVKCVTAIAGMLHAGYNDAHLAMHQAGAPAEILKAMATWPDDEHVQSGSLCALFHCWGGGLPPFHDTALTPRVVDATLDAMTKTKALLVYQAALRLICAHTFSQAKLYKLPTVAMAVATAMAAHSADDIVQHFGARIVLNLLSIEECDVKGQFGASGIATLHEMAIKTAASTKQGHEETIGGVPWSQVVLRHVFPRLRSQSDE